MGKVQILLVLCLLENFSLPKSIITIGMDGLKPYNKLCCEFSLICYDVNSLITCSYAFQAKEKIRFREL